MFGISHLEQAKAWLRRLAQKALGVDKQYLPYALGADDYAVLADEQNIPTGDDGLPIPPQRLWLGYAASSDEYLESGQWSVNSMQNDMEGTGMSVENCHRILDFGCGGGRMIRWLKPYAQTAEIWGVDISAEHIFWCTQYLTPPFHFATTMTLPHLPFDDGYFDFIYAGSVFTHIDDLASAWLQELRRILKPGGRMYISLHDDHTVSIIRPEYIEQELPEVIRRTGQLRKGQKNLSRLAHANAVYRRASASNFNMIVYGRRHLSQVFFDIDYFTTKIASNLKIVAINRESQYFQTAVIMERKA